MSIKILQETTDWGTQGIKNGVYHVNEKGWLVQFNDKKFKNPLKGFSKTRRTFKQIGKYDE